MTGLSILIIDDDKLLVDKLEKTMRWDRLGIQTVFTAYNIRQARSLMEEYPVQILLCDIDMPQGSGLELLEWVRDQEMDVECVFLSSYANFAYAQMAIQLSSRAYLLKPISNADLEHALERVVETVQKKQKELHQAAEAPRGKLWEDLLLRRVPEELCIRKAVQEEICGPTERFSLVLVRALESASQVTEKKDVAIFDFVIRNIASEFFQSADGLAQKGADHPDVPEQRKADHPAGSFLEAVVHISDLEWLLVLKAEGADPVELVRKFTAQLRPALERQMGIYLGEPTAFPEIASSREHLEYLEGHAVPDGDSILYEKDWKAFQKQSIAVPWEIWKKELLQADCLEQTRDRLLGCIESQRADGGWRRESMDDFLRELVQMLYQYLDEKKCSYAQMFDSREFRGYERAACASVAGAREFVTYIFEKLASRQGASASQKDVIWQVREYIEQHLGDPISRADLAGQVYLSEGYLSRIFLKETGISLPNYIAERRIEKAKEYLENSALPVSRIATEVGYNNFSYFSKTFRELTGCTPNEYRVRITKNVHRE